MHAATDPLLTEDQAAELLGVAPATLQVWRSTRRYPLDFVKVGRVVRYRSSAIETFINSRTVQGDRPPASSASTSRVRPRKPDAPVAQTVLP